MKIDQFAVAISKLETLFNQGVQLDEAVRMQYYEALKYVSVALFQDAIIYIRDTFKPFPSEPFPSIATIQLAIIEVSEEKKEDRQADAIAEFEYCQKCDNFGLYIDADGQARFCVCEHGRLKKACWNVSFGERKRDEKIEKALKRLPKSQGPVRGLKELNPLGFWEDTQEEHDRWMAAKQVEIDKIQHSQTQRVPRPSLPEELKMKIIQDTIANLKEKKPLKVYPFEPGEDEDAIPF